MRMCEDHIASDECLGAFETGTDFVFCNVRQGRIGRGLTEANACEMQRGLVRRSGVEFAWHRFRHTHASEAIAQGYSLLDVADRLGRASPQTTSAIYKHREAHFNFCRLRLPWLRDAARAYLLDKIDHQEFGHASVGRNIAEFTLLERCLSATHAAPAPHHVTQAFVASTFLNWGERPGAGWQELVRRLRQPDLLGVPEPLGRRLAIPDARQAEPQEGAGGTGPADAGTRRSCGSAPSPRRWSSRSSRASEPGRCPPCTSACSSSPATPA